MTRHLLLLLLLGVPTLAQVPTKLVFMGFPSRRSMNMIGNNKTDYLEEKDSKEYICMITLKDGKYYWSSRDNKIMTRHVSGEFIIFTAIDGSGYLKLMPGLVGREDVPLDYMEHLHDKLFTITYWGRTSTYRE